MMFFFKYVLKWNVGAGVNNVLKEDGANLLMEDGSAILL